MMTGCSMPHMLPGGFGRRDGIGLVGAGNTGVVLPQAVFKELEWDLPWVMILPCLGDIE